MSNIHLWVICDRRRICHETAHMDCGRATNNSCCYAVLTSLSELDK